MHRGYKTISPTPMDPLEGIAEKIKSSDDLHQTIGIFGLRRYLQGRDASVEAVLGVGILPALIKCIDTNRNLQVLRFIFSVVDRVLQRGSHPATAQCMQEVLNEDSIRTLVQALTSGNEFLVCESARVLERLACCCEELRLRVRRSGFVEALVPMLFRHPVGQNIARVTPLIRLLYGDLEGRSSHSLALEVIRRELKGLSSEASSKLVETLFSDYASLLDHSSADDLVTIFESVHWSMMDDFPSRTYGKLQTRSSATSKLISLLKSPDEKEKQSALRCLSELASQGEAQSRKLIEEGVLVHIGPTVLFWCLSSDTIRDGIRLIQVLLLEAEELTKIQCLKHKVMAFLELLYHFGDESIKVMAEVSLETIKNSRG